MTDILEEVLHEQRAERQVLFFKKIFPLIIILTIVTALAMLVNNWYSEAQNKNNMQKSDLLIKAITSTNQELVEEALSSFINDNSASKIAELAALNRVAIKITAGDIEQAKALLEEIINNTNYQPLTSSYARISWLSLLIDKPQLSDKESSQFREYLQYYNDEHQVFFGIASLLKAMWYTKTKQHDLALEVLKEIMALEDLPLSVKEQAKALLARNHY